MDPIVKTCGGPMGHKLAIDFGTTNSVVARWDDKGHTAQLVALPGLSVDRGGNSLPLIPSLLYVHDGRSGEVTAGQAVIEGQLDRRRDNRLFRNFKRGIAASPTPRPRLINGVPWTDQAAGQCFLRRLVDALPYALQDVEQLVVSVPVAAVAGYADWLCAAMEGLPPERVRIVDESTAAALGYAVTEPGTIVLILDFGGGSLDLSLVQLPQTGETGSLLERLLQGKGQHRTAHVIAKAGITLGGSDIDQWLLGAVLDHIGLPAQEVQEDYAPLLAACERCKIELSSAESTTAHLYAGGQPHAVHLERSTLESLTEKNGFYAALRRAVDKVMSAARRQGVYREDVAHVLLIGGTSLIPSIQQRVARYLQDTPLRQDKPFTAVAEGALRVAAGLGLQDRLAYSYGLRCLDPESGEHAYDEIIPAGSPCPTERPVQVILGAAHPDQQTIEFVIGRIETDAVSMAEVAYDEGMAAFVARADRGVEQIIPLKGLGPDPTLVALSPPGQPGQDRLRAELAVDDQQWLRLTVLDQETGKRLLHDEVVAGLDADIAGRADKGSITGREPRLSRAHLSGRRRLSLRRLATALNLMPPESVSLQVIQKALHSADMTARFSAAEMLGRRGDRDARRLVEEVLAHEPPPLRASVARHLHRFAWFGARPLFCRALADADERVRANAVYALCKVRTDDAYRLLAEALADENDTLRLEAAWGLIDSSNAGAVPVLAIAMQAQDPEARAKVLEALGATGAPEALPIARRALDDPAVEVRYAAAFCLVELAKEACLPELASAIERTEGPAREAILRGLYHATNYFFVDIASSAHAGLVVDALEAALRDDLAETRFAAAKPLAWMDDDRAAAALCAGYHLEPDGETKARILREAVDVASPGAEELLQDALQSEDALVRETAEFVLQRGGR
jgi:molecular chaperone DnaK (HSP70)/HEAT repeat protein